MKGVFDAGSGSVSYWSGTNSLVITNEIPAGLALIITSEDGNTQYGEMTKVEAQFLVQDWQVV